jgi:predicted nuclease of restriction endonuclease-like (RecB) superfamily
VPVPRRPVDTTCHHATSATWIVPKRSVPRHVLPAPRDSTCIVRLPDFGLTHRAIRPASAACCRRSAPSDALIEAARTRAYQAVNSELVSLYWQLGEYIGRKIESAEWGDGVVDDLAATLARRYPGARGFTRPNLFRMRQFYRAYRDNEKVSALLRQLPWTHHLIILGQARPPDTREFYILTAVRERWSSRELERQIRSGAALRSPASARKVSSAVTQTHPTAVDEFKNAYSLEFLSLPDHHSEADLHGALLRNLGRFISELGRDFCFVGSEYPIQVGNRDFAIDLVFFHRGLTCLVAFELKVRRFEPEDLGKLSFYVEALDRDVRKPHERPSIGVLLCATKDDEVVEYALARTTSPTLVAEYQTMLPPKALLRQKLHELYAQLATDRAFGEPTGSTIAIPGRKSGKLRPAAPRRRTSRPRRRPAPL